MIGRRRQAKLAPRATAINLERDIPLRQHTSHPRTWRDNLYVYPVISRRSRGLSIGVNLNPDAACNFDCIYCQVDRTILPRIRDVDPAVLGHELDDMIRLASSGELFLDREFADVPAHLRAIRDVAFSGDGEPTTCVQFVDCVDVVVSVLRSYGLADVRIVLITDACYLTKPPVIAGLAVMDRNNGEIWAKLDAGTEDYYRLVNRPNYPLQHVIDNIVAAARVRPVVIQSLFMRVHGAPPSHDEVTAYVARLNEVQRSGGKISLVQVYTVARRPTESYVSALSAQELDAIVHRVVTEAHVPAEPYYGTT